MDLRRYAATLWSAAWLIALSLVLAVVIAVAVASQLPRTFESRATLYVGQSLDDPGLGYTSILASQAVAQSYAQLVTTRPMLEGAIKDLGLDGTIDPDELAQRVTAEVPDQGVLLQILVRDADADQSSKLANAIAQQMLDRAPARDEAQEATQKERLAQLDARIKDSEDQILALLAKPDRTPDDNVAADDAGARAADADRRPRVARERHPGHVAQRADGRRVRGGADHLERDLAGHHRARRGGDRPRPVAGRRVRLGRVAPLRAGRAR